MCVCVPMAVHKVLFQCTVEPFLIKDTLEKRAPLY